MKIIAAFLVSLAFLSSAQADKLVFLVRHAEKQDQSADSRLSEIGKARAGKLATMLKDARVGAIFTSEMLRAVGTAEPLAQALKLAPQTIDARKTAELVAKIRGMRADRALVVGHSNTVPEIAKQLGVGEPITLGERDYDDLFVISVSASDAKLVRLHY